MSTPLPREAWVAGGALSFAAGLMNAVGLLAFGNEAVTHLTGTTSLIAGHLAFGRFDRVLHLGSILVAFCAGAAFSGGLIDDGQPPGKLSVAYGKGLGLETLLVLAAAQAFAWQAPVAYALLAAAVGLQNGMATLFTGAVMRTSHLTGMFTDLAIDLGRRWAGRPVARQRLAICLLVISGFLAGGLVGAFGMKWMGTPILGLAATITGALAVLVRLRRPRAAGKVTG